MWELPEDYKDRMKDHLDRDVRKTLLKVEPQINPWTIQVFAYWDSWLQTWRSMHVEFEAHGHVFLLTNLAQTSTLRAEYRQQLMSYQYPRPSKAQASTLAEVH